MDLGLLQHPRQNLLLQKATTRRNLNKNLKKSKQKLQNVIITRNSVYPLPRDIFLYISVTSITTFPGTNLILIRNWVESQF